MNRKVMTMDTEDEWIITTPFGDFTLTCNSGNVRVSVATVHEISANAWKQGEKNMQALYVRPSSEDPI